MVSGVNCTDKGACYCGVTLLGMDHTETLGDTIDKIASHKAGIFKPKVPAFTVYQPSKAMDVLHQRADELQVVSLFAHQLLMGVRISELLNSILCSFYSLQIPLEVPPLNPKSLKELNSVYLMITNSPMLDQLRLISSLLICCKIYFQFHMYKFPTAGSSRRVFYFLNCLRIRLN
uniref:Uncharacterized protein n=1 Tax=Kalanchoe fedtschenkoi TaxID=63787 RepID=A0A7N0VBD4_KALFE